PYGIKDRYAEGCGMQMELINNQITREQGVHSPRLNYHSFGLYFMARNISVPTTVLDFPKWKDFVKELKKGYTHVGISFIVPNVLKAKRMAEYIRKNYPKTKIILGGYGTIIPNLKEIMPYDEICPGEGISWLREYFGENREAPIVDAYVIAPLIKHIYGHKIKNRCVNIFPGLGCKNACSFCATSHKFGKKYVPFLSTGADVFASCLNAEKKSGVKNFGIIDENFLKQPERAKELLSEMEKHSKPYLLDLVFSSAEKVKELGVDFLVRLGVNLIWIGAESKNNIFKKTEGIDLQKLFAELQSKGIRIIASTILFLEHHDKESIQEDVDWAIGLNSEMLQFMQLIPYPGTKIYHQYTKEGKMIKNFPYTMQHGQDKLAFKHPNFKASEARYYTRNAFREKYETHGSAILNMAITATQGYKQAKEDFEYRKKHGLCWNPETLRYEKTKNPKPDKFMKLRIEVMRKEALFFRPTLLVSKVFAPNKACRKKNDMAIKLYNEVFGKPKLKEKVMSIVLLASGTVEAARIKIWKLLGRDEFARQPPTRRVEYHNRK
ncbi:radical SAM protein, partial [Candidatus Woesearchaeota archaeon]|nr:radical SAM protein [Candidatus Woesearchaeota archaeon]